MNSSIVLICAVLASLAAGVLAAYVVCQAMFALFHGHARQIARNPEPTVAITNQIAEG